MRIRSLHTQVNLVLAILTFTVLVQLYSAYTNLSTLIQNQAILSVSHDNVGIIYKLERDVIDLQRNLLIYKETGSDSSIERFHEVIERVNSRINTLSMHVGEGDEYPEPLFAILNFAKITDSPMTGEWVMEVDWVKHEYLKIEK